MVTVELLIAETVLLILVDLDNSFLPTVSAMIAQITKFQTHQTDLEINVSDQNAQKPQSSLDLVHVKHVKQVKIQIKVDYTVSMSSVVLDPESLQKTQ